MSKNQTAQRAEILGNEKIIKLIIQYALPAIAMLMISSLYNIVDKAFVGNFVGQIGITATTVCSPASRLIDAFAVMIGAGGSTLLALKLGEGKEKEAEDILNRSFLMMVMIFVVLLILCYSFLTPLLSFLGAGDQVMPYARTYLRIVLVGSIFNATANGYGQFVRVDGSPKRMMICSATGCILNIILDPIAIYVLNLGIAGAAIATVISQIVSGMLVIHYFTLSKRSTMKLRLSKMRLHRATAVKTTELGLSSFLQQFTGSISQAVLMSSLTYFAVGGAVSGEVAQASVGITTSIGLFFVLPAMGISAAIQPIVSYNYGAKNYDRVISTLKTGAVFAVLLLSVGWVIIRLFAQPLCMMFGSTGSDLEHAVYTMKVYNLFLPLVSFCSVGSGFFQSIGEPKKAVFVSLSRQLLGMLPMIFILGNLMGQNGVLYALPASDLVTAVIALTMLAMQCRSMRRAQRETV